MYFCSTLIPSIKKALGGMWHVYEKAQLKGEVVRITLRSTVTLGI